MPITTPDFVLAAIPDWSLYSSITASSEADANETPATNLKTDYLFDRWRSFSAAEPDCVLDVVVGNDLGLFAPDPFKLLGLGAMVGNFSEEAMVRVMLSDDLTVAVPARTRLVPNALTTSDFTGTVGDIDEDPDSPDANELVPVDIDQQVIQALVGFPTPGALSDKRLVHQARALVQLKSAGLQSIETPVQLFLAEAGTNVRELRQVILRSGDTDTDVLLIGHFSAAEISNPADLELRVVRDLDLTGGDEADLRIKAVDIQYQATLAAGLYDSGMVDVWPAILQDGFEQIHPSEVRAGSVPFTYHFLDGSGDIAHVDALRMRVEFVDPDNPDEFLELGALPFGPGVAARLLERGASVHGTDAVSAIVRSAGDRDLPIRGVPRGGFRFNLRGLSRQQALGTIMRYLGRRSWTHNFLASLLPSDEDFRTELRLFGHLAGRPAQVVHMAGSRDLWQAQIDFEEAR